MRLISSSLIGKGQFVMMLIFLTSSFTLLHAQTKTFSGTGNWSSAANWSPSGVPTSANTVIIATGANVTVDGNYTCDSIYFAAGASNSTISISGTNKLTATRGVRFSNPSANVTQLINVNAGFLEGDVLVQPDLTTGRVNRINITTGTIKVNKDFTSAGSTAENIIEFTDAGKFRLGGTWTSATGTFTNATSSFEYFSVNPSQSIRSRTYNKLILSGDTKVPGGSIICNDSLIVNSGATLNNSGSASITLNSVFYIAGIYSEGSTIGNVILNGLVHIAPTGTFQATVGESFTIGGGIKNEGTFISGTTTSTYTFATNNQTLSGNKMFTFAGGVTVTGITLTSSDSVRINGTFQGTGTFVNQSYLLLMGATNSITTLNALGSGNIVEYGFAGTQTVKGTSYKKLRLTASGVKTSNANVNVGDELNIGTGATFAMSTFLLTLDPSCLITGTGNLTTANITATPIPAGKVWPYTTITYNSGSAQTIVNGTYTNLTSSNAARTLSNTGLILINGTFTPGSSTYTSTGSTVQFNSASTQAIPGIVGGYNKIVLNNGIKNPSGTLTCNDSLIINPGATLNNSGTANLSFNGIFYIAGTYIEGSTSGSVTLVGLIHIAPTGTFQVNVAEIFDIRGGIKNEGTFISGTGTYTFATNNQALTGTKMFTFAGGVTVTGITLTSSDSVRINGTFQGTGTFVNQSYLLLMGATNSITTLNLASAGNTVVYGAAGTQTVIGANYKNMHITGSGTKTSNGNIAVATELFIDASPTLAMSTFLLTLDPACLITGTGNLSTANTTSTPIPVGKTWPFTTITYNSGSAQTIVYGTYNNLTSSNFARTLSATDTIHIKGIFTSGTGAYTSTGSTVNFNGTSTQNIPNVSGGYNRLVINGSSVKTATANITVISNLNVSSISTLNMSTFNIVSATTTNSGTGLILTASTSNIPLPSAVFWNCTVEYNSSSNQTLTTGTYSNLRFTGAGTKTANGVITVNQTLNIGVGITVAMGTNQLSGTLTSIVGTGVLSTANTTSTPIPSGKTWPFDINYVSASSQTVVNGNYLNLNTTGGNRVLASSGIIGISGTFTPGAGTFTNTGSTIEFNGSASQTIPVFTFNNLTSSNTGARTLASGTITVQGNFTSGSNSYTITGNTMVFPTATQNISGTFNNLTLNTAGTKTAIGNINVAGTISVASGVTLDLTSAYILNGTLTTISNSGTIKTAVPTTTSTTPVSAGKTWGGTIEYAGSNPQTVPLGVYTNLTISGASVKNTSDNITINGTLTFTSGKLNINNTTLTLTGSVVNTVGEGIKSGGNANLVLNGNLARTINFDQSEPNLTNKINSLTNNSSAQTTTIGSKLLVTNTVIPTSGTINANGNLVLVSDNASTARIAQGTGSYITGNVTVQRYIPESARRWRFLSSAATNATIEDLRNETFVTGPGTGNTIGTTNSNGYDATQSNAAGIYWYDETLTTGDINTGWTIPANTSHVLAPGKGYRVFVRGDRSDINRITNVNLTQNQVTLDVNGPVNSGDITMPISFSSSGNVNNDGWNLIGNPYPSAFDWNAFHDAGRSGNSGTNYTNIEPTIWVLDPIDNTYKFYNALSNAGNITNGVVAQGQGFWVKATGSGAAITFKEAFKTASTPTNLFKNTEGGAFKIRVSKDSLNADELLVKYISGSTKTFDAYDVYKLSSPIVISSYGTDNVHLSLSARPLSTTQNDTIKLYVYAATSGNYNMQFSNSNSIAVQDQILLIDNFTNTVTDLKNTSNYSFTVATNNAASFGLNRFYIVVANNSQLPVKLMGFNAQKTAQKQVALTWATAQEKNSNKFEIQHSTDGYHFNTIGWVDAKGNSNALTTYKYLHTNPNEVNYYRLKQVDNNLSFEYSSIVKVDFNTADAELPEAVSMYPIPAINDVTLALTNKHEIAAISIYNLDGKLIHTRTTQSAVVKLDLANYASGVYLIQLEDEFGEIITHKFTKD